MRIFYTLISIIGFLLVFSSCNSDEDFYGVTPPPTENSPEVSPEKPYEKPTTDIYPFYRPKTEFSKDECNAVFTYLPAPGQFINDVRTSGFNGTETTTEAANLYALNRLNKGYTVSLGAFGGYIVVGFDHSIDNTGGFDFYIKGNPLKNASEPGIVYVMQDENGDGLPNDTWYELKGSDHDEAIKNYSVTYYKPTGAGENIRWTDNLGGSGEIDYLKSFHDQDTYYPLWVTNETYTLSGTCLKPKNYDSNGDGSYWILPGYDWGYVDNYSSVDLSSSMANRFRISNAIDENGNSVDLKYIDFIKIQTGVQSKSGWVGEMSTEVTKIYDLQ